MRKAEREITNFEEILNVFERCDTIRIGISDEPAPYIVPVSFGFEAFNGKIAVLWRSALSDAQQASERATVDGRGAGGVPL